VIKKFGNLLLLGLAIFSFSALSATTPSPAMMAQFQKLPKSEQQRLMKQYGLNSRGLAGSSKISEQQSADTEWIQEEIEQPVDVQFEENSGKPERFGLKLFKNRTGSQLSQTNAPVPENYILGAGDELLVQVFGKESYSENLLIDREGAITIPELGPVTVAGLTFSEARAVISDRIKKRILGVDVAVSMGELKTITIFVAGEATKPGSYTIPSLSSVTQALVAAGGVTDIGSLRNIQVKRGTTTVAVFDLYDLLLRGDASNDVALQHGDVVFVAPVQGIAEVVGEVQRPAIYEVNSGETIGQLLAMAGGPKAVAYTQSAILERVNSQNLRDLLNLDLTQQLARMEPVRSGDVLRIGVTSPRYENVVTVAGAVVRPGKYAWRDGLRVTDLLGSLWSDLHLTVDLDYAIVLREVNANGALKVLQFNLGEAVTSPESAQNLRLNARDQIIVFHYDNKSFERQQLNILLQEKLEESGVLKRLSVPQSQTAAPGAQTELSLEMDNLMEQGFELLQKQQKQTGEVPDIAQPKPEQKWLIAQVTHLLTTALVDPESLSKTPHLTRSELLYPVLEKIKSRNNAYTGSQIVIASGEVKVPGEYPLTENATVQSLIAAAGGLKESAYTQRAELTRATSDSSGGDMTVAHKHINLATAMATPGQYILQARDRLNIFAIPNWNIERQVKLTGFVRFPGVYTIQQGETLSSILSRAGGLKAEAFAEGAVFTRKQTRERESEQIQKLAQQLRTDIAARSLTSESSAVNPQDALAMISEIEKVKPAGRLVVDLMQIMEGAVDYDIAAEDGDELFVPPLNTSVSVVGEVQHASSHRFKRDLTLDDYLALAGGFRKRADEDRVYVIRADGSVFMPQTAGWFAVRAETLRPGDTIVVPLDTEFKDSLSLWTEITQIFYQSAVALAAVNSF
jgi:polysaccharide biosynthesis/export protein